MEKASFLPQPSIHASPLPPTGLQLLHSEREPEREAEIFLFSECLLGFVLEGKGHFNILTAN